MVELEIKTGEDIYADRYEATHSVCAGIQPSEKQIAIMEKRWVSVSSLQEAVVSKSPDELFALISDIVITAQREDLGLMQKQEALK